MRNLTKLHFESDCEEVVEEIVDTLFRYKKFLDGAEGDFEDCKKFQDSIDGSDSEEDMVMQCVMSYLWNCYDQLLVFSKAYKHIKEMLKEKDERLEFLKFDPSKYNASPAEAMMLTGDLYITNMMDNMDKIRNTFYKAYHDSVRENINSGGEPICQLIDGVYHISMIPFRSYIIYIALDTFNTLYSSAIDYRNESLGKFVSSEMLIFGNFFEFIGGSDKKIMFENISMEASKKAVMRWALEKEERKDFYNAYKLLLEWMHMFSYKDVKLVREMVTENAMYQGKLFVDIAKKFMMDSIAIQDTTMTDAIERIVDAHIIERKQIEELQK